MSLFLRLPLLLLLPALRGLSLLRRRSASTSLTLRRIAVRSIYRLTRIIALIAVLLRISTIALRCTISLLTVLLICALPAAIWLIILRITLLLTAVLSAAVLRIPLLPAEFLLILLLISALSAAVGVIVLRSRASLLRVAAGDKHCFFVVCISHVFFSV